MRVLEFISLEKLNKPTTLLLHFRQAFCSFQSLTYP